MIIRENTVALMYDCVRQVERNPHVLFKAAEIEGRACATISLNNTRMCEFVLFPVKLFLLLFIEENSTFTCIQ